MNKDIEKMMKVSLYLTPLLELTLISKHLKFKFGNSGELWLLNSLAYLKSIYIQIGLYHSGKNKEGGERN